MTLTDLLSALERGVEVRFDNSVRPRLLPPVHPFHVTCPCADCALVWEGGR